MTDNTYGERFHELSKLMAKDLIDRGLLIRAGCKTLLTLQLPSDREEVIRYAFFAGAEHVFSTLMNMLDEGKDATEDDMRRMSMINEELNRWRKTAMAVLESSPRGHA